MRRFPALAAALLLFSSHANADFNDGVYALLTGEYDTALQHLVPLAETSDHAYAQYFLGRMYDRGQGVEQNYDTAAKWYRKASEKGVADAQYRLGLLYTEGTGVPKDPEYAYGWYSVAAHLGNNKAIAALESSQKQLSSEELAEARKLSAQLIEKYGTVSDETARRQ